MSGGARFGLSAALTTPFREDGRIDLAKMVAHARRCLAEGCDSITLFGTTGEGPSISRDERTAVFAAMIAGGISTDRIVCGVTETAVATATELARVALASGCRNVMLTPPFYFKNPSDEGIHDWYAAVFAGLGDAARDVILYHIPSATLVPLSLDLILRLAAEFPDIVWGIKDSGCDWPATEKLLAARGALQIMVGDERDLARAVRMGGSGAISGLANVCPGRVRGLAVDGRDDPAVSSLVDEVLRLPVTPAVKSLLAHVTGDPGWARTRAPLETTPPEAAAALAAFHDRVFPDARLRVKREGET